MPMENFGVNEVVPTEDGAAGGAVVSGAKERRFVGSVDRIVVGGNGDSRRDFAGEWRGVEVE